MKYAAPTVLFLALSITSCAPKPPATQPVTSRPDEWRLLFNGQDLSGWRRTGSAIWRVEYKEGWPGMIVGTQDGDPKRAGNLVSVDQFQNFELELEFMIDEHGKYNSGVYLRNPPGGGKNGYQVNIGRGAAGEYCGGIVITDAPGAPPGTPTWLAKGDEADKIRKPLDWNTLRILADGPHIVVNLNHKLVADFTDPNPDPRYLQKGVIALQTYGAEGYAGWVKFRNIRIRELP
ncbi:MAG TPA: DUF1080 domain-containing protein [Tepidisphaeraceae bacterium]